MSAETKTTEDIQAIASAFGITAAVATVTPNTTGHIHQTYVVEMADGDVPMYIFQQVNNTIFKDVDGLMENIVRVTNHIYGKLQEEAGVDVDRGTLRFLAADSGKYYHVTDEGKYWRAYVYVDGVRTYDVLENAEQAYQAAKAFGKFQKQLADLQGGPLNETLEFFHHTPKRFETLEKAIEADSEGRLAKCGPEVEFAMAHKAMTSKAVDMLADGSLPLRVTHNDCKVNNVLIDDETGKGICVIDLDTIMPGTVLYDFGDMIRTFTPTSVEDEVDLDKFGIDLEIFESLVKGYLEEARDVLVPAEIDNLVYAGQLITFTIGIRFLADYLTGDTYFRTTREDQNLDRCRTQFKLVSLVEENQSRMEQIVRDAAS